MRLKRLPNPEAHKKFIVSFCDKGDITVKFVKGLKVACATLIRGRAYVLLREPLITDFHDAQWDWDAYHEASHILPEQRYVYEALKMCKTGLEKTILNVLADNMCERCRHGKYKGRDRATYRGRYECTMDNYDTIMIREHPAISALYVEDLRDRNKWQGFFPEMKGMEGSDYYLPSIEALDISHRIPMIMKSESAEDFYELITDIANIARQQPPQQEDQDDNSEPSTSPDSTDNDRDESSSSDSDSDLGDNSGTDGEDADPEGDSEEEGEVDEQGDPTEAAEGSDEEWSDQDDDIQTDKGSQSGSDEGEDEAGESEESGGSSDLDGHGDSGTVDDGDSGDSDSDSDGNSSDNSGDVATDSSGDGDQDDGDSSDSSGGNKSAASDGTGSGASWESINEDTIDLPDAERQLLEPDQRADVEIQNGHYIPIANYQLVQVDRLSGRPYHRSEIIRHSEGTALTRSVQKYLRCMSKDTYQYGMERGRVHAKHIPRIFTAERKPKIFKQRQSHILRTDTAFTLLLDCSNSMESRRYCISAAATLVLSETLRQLGITHEILGFTEDERIIYIYEFKAFSEVLGHDRLLDRLSKNIEMHYTPDAESIVFAGSRLMERTEENKILMVLCDGQPMGSFQGDGEWYLKTVCETIENSGLMKLIGIGIELEDVRRFYKNHAVVNDLQGDLEPVMIKVLAESLL